MKNFLQGCVVGLLVAAFILIITFLFPMLAPFSIILWPASLLGVVLTNSGPMTLDRFIIYSLMFMGNALTYGIIWLVAARLLGMNRAHE